MKRKKVFVSGCFDMLHSGHVRFLQEAAGYGDVYVALGEPLEGGAWAVRIYVKPFVRWIWLGGLFMMVGGFVAASDRRFRALPERAQADVQRESKKEIAPGNRRATPSPPNPPLEGEDLA